MKLITADIKGKILSKNDPTLNLIIDELAQTYHCHTIILYGSRARGDYTSTSDYDVAGITRDGEKRRVARQENDVYLDIFIYPENEFTVLREEHLTMIDGIVLKDSHEFGKNLLLQLSHMINEPELIPDDEVQARKIWYQKMLSRASNRDLEGKYRHIWSIFTILEDYFVFKGMRYQGPKKGFQYLEIHDQDTLELFNDALSNTNDLGALKKLISKIVN